MDGISESQNHGISDMLRTLNSVFAGGINTVLFTITYMYLGTLFDLFRAVKFICDVYT